MKNNDTKSADRSALIALTALVAGASLVAAFGFAQQLLADFIPTEVTDTALRGPIEGYWLPEFTARDTYAQWVMAVLALVATAISLVGLLLVRVTFVETRRTAEAAIDSNAMARRLGEAQVRAYVSWDSAVRQTAHASNTGDLVAFVLTPIIRNTGQSPASLRLLYVDLPDIVFGEVIPSVHFQRSGEVEHDLGSGNTFNMPDRHISKELAVDIFNGRKRCFLAGYGEYRDVFWSNEIDTRTFKFCFEILFQTPPDHLPIEQVFNGLQLHNVPNFSISPL